MFPPRNECSWTNCFDKSRRQYVVKTSGVGFEGWGVSGGGEDGCSSKFRLNPPRINIRNGAPGCHKLACGPLPPSPTFSRPSADAQRFASCASRWRRSSLQIFKQVPWKFPRRISCPLSLEQDPYFTIDLLSLRLSLYFSQVAVKGVESYFSIFPRLSISIHLVASDSWCFNEKVYPLDTRGNSWPRLKWINWLNTRGVGAAPSSSLQRRSIFLIFTANSQRPK